MAFIGRRQELKALCEKYEQGGFQLAIVYGRRRIGKTTLINRFVDEFQGACVSFVAVERTERELLQMLGDTVLAELSPNLLGSVHFESFESVFDFITQTAQSSKLIFVIDEYPYLAKACPAIGSILQKFIDHNWKNTQLYLVLCGSLVSFMGDEVLGPTAPLHGRSTLEIKLKALDYRDAGQFVPTYGNEEKALVYGLTGGVPKYLEQFDPNKSLEQNIVEQFYTSTGYFTEEQIKTLVTAEKANPTAYSSIIAAVANGHTKYAEIASATGMADVSYYLKVLTSAELLEKRVSKRPYYVLADGMVEFWFKYVDRATSLINAGRGGLYYERMVTDRLHEHMGKVFEHMARQYMFAHMLTEDIPFFASQIDEYQGSLKDERGDVHQVELDLVGYEGKDIVFVGECKFRNKPFGKRDLDVFLDKIAYLPVHNPHLVLFSLGGFAQEVREQDDLILVDIDRMYSAD